MKLNGRHFITCFDDVTLPQRVNPQFYAFSPVVNRYYCPSGAFAADRL
ncbi:hypothetical protein EDC91_1514 [Shewanella fodinae]|uniref:Uncharacterized protein n=1 Tax=Shewanella fodinae TaxID=552357 RepID=A0A4R2F034_9GAMM|nr:hypothetical protein EDC91_1514 [Shewanella fodinae]